MRRLLFKKFWPVSSMRYWFTRRFTKGGLLAIAGLLMTGGLAMDSEQSLAYQTFGLLLCLLFIALIFSLGFRGQFAVQRRLPRFGTVGVPLRYTITVENKTRKRQRGLVLLEDMVDPRDEAIVNTQPLIEWGPIRVVWRYRKPMRVAKTEEATIPAVEAGSSVAAESTLVPLRRGILRFDGLTLGRPDPLGLFRSFVRLRHPHSLAILPRRYPVSPLALPGSMQYQPGGVAMAAAIGESEEFVSMRDYRRGDPMRHIHWKSWAKVGKPIVKEFQDEYFVRHALVLDTFAGPEKSDVFEEAVSVAASFAYTINTQESLLDLMFVGAEAFCFTSGRGLAHTEQMLEILAAVRLCPAKKFNVLEGLVLKHAELLSGCICILLGWDEPRRKLVHKLQALGIPLLVLVLVEPGKTIGDVSDAPAAFHVIEADKVEEGLMNL